MPKWWETKLEGHTWKAGPLNMGVQARLNHAETVRYYRAHIVNRYNKGECNWHGTETTDQVEAKLEGMRKLDELKYALMAKERRERRAEDQVVEQMEYREVAEALATAFAGPDTRTPKGFTR